jgi:tetratricopeptide (TPR) repeat protein
VVNVLPQKPEPAKLADVNLWSQDVQCGHGRTGPRGEVALLHVSPGAAQTGDLRVEISHAGDLVIYLPAGGLLNSSSALPTNLTVQLLPKGSQLLIKGPGQIEAMLHRMSLEIASLQKQNTTLRQDAAATRNQKPDLGAAIAEWAQANGFSADEVNKTVEQWADVIQKQSDQATTEQKALAELALKHYDAAAQLFHLATNADLQQLNAEDAQEQSLEAQVKALQAAQQALLDKERNSLRDLINHAQQTASADQLSLNYHEATQTLESAAETANGEYKKHPGDKGLHELWLQALRAEANAREREGSHSPADQSLTLLAQAADDDRLLIREYTALADREGAAAAKNNLGNALDDEGGRASSDKAIALLDEAVEAYRIALDVRTKSDLPRDWAMTQMNLGIALEDEGELASGDKAMALLDQAVAAYRSALEVRTKADLPQDWAQTQDGLGSALTVQAERSSGDKAIAFLGQAIAAYENTLEVFTEVHQPQNWASTQFHLGAALFDAGELEYGVGAIPLFDLSVEAYRNALKVYTRTDLPQDWASAQNGLGITLRDEGELASGERATSLLNQAVDAFRSALEVRTKSALPQGWAQTQMNLGNALEDEGERAAGDEAMALLDQAVVAYRNALEVDTREHMPWGWAAAQSNLGIALTDEGERAGGDRAAALLDQADQAFRSALEVDPNSIKILEGASHLDHELLFRFDEALRFDELRAKIDPSPSNKLDLLEADLTAAHFNDCIQIAGSISDGALTPGGRLIRDTLNLACQWGSGNSERTLAAEKLFAPEAATTSRSSWVFTGTLHFLANSPAFAPGRNAWIALFTAEQNGDNAGMTAALRQLEPILQR